MESENRRSWKEIVGAASGYTQSKILKWMAANPEDGLAICREFFVQVPLKVVGPAAPAKVENEMVDTTGELVIPMKMPSIETGVLYYLLSYPAEARQIVVDVVRWTLSGGTADLLDALFEAKLEAIAPSEPADVTDPLPTISIDELAAYGPSAFKVGHIISFGGVRKYLVTPSERRSHFENERERRNYKPLVNPLPADVRKDVASDGPSAATFAIMHSNVLIERRRAIAEAAGAVYIPPEDQAIASPAEDVVEPPVEPEETEHDQMYRFFAGK